MMRKTKLLFVCVVMTFASCVGPITQDDDGKTYEFPLNTPFTVELQGQPGSPMVWMPYDYDSTVIRREGDPEIETQDINGDRYKIFRFTFRTVSAGKTILQMVYSLAEEEGGIPADTFTIHIISGTMGRIESDE